MSAPDFHLGNEPSSTSEYQMHEDEAIGIDVLASAFAHPGVRAQNYRLSREEMLKGLANRFVHSTTYMYLYATMGFLSLLTVVLSLSWTCPGPAFYILELIVNVALVAEVAVRFVAFGKHFWKSAFNIVDLCLVAMCILTLVFVFFGHGCSPYAKGAKRREELLDSLLLITRNVIQCIRLVSVVRRSGYNVARRVTAIDLDDVHDFNLDMDLEEESSLVQQRMRDGGDTRGAEIGWIPRVAPQQARSKDTIIAIETTYDDGEL
ncbi:hypothetical protein MVES1_002180 [Malassezia vespertilionis]|uniref:Ion transport domain-containing protein n=1 Tax=Malassezia vespertilionis TaxID=2020962 RepID=A0A2N1JBU6_9BASI|nr:uncharacterized protein MVES1_002180 [Malassezia vespertilionis]PKI84030.1 hypothetical protein MVES_002056 [Malassezia vespertilionis]WFD06826.1 hypothetical protein MVES1_002180 [Malassezia vespertilionis]